MNRFYSLDVFRGATVALMILVNNPGSWSYIYAPLKHAPWHGCTPTDLVFPFFLFAVGNAMAFVMPKLNTPSLFWRKVTRRFILIFGIGLLLNWFPFIKWSDNVLVGKPFEILRILGVLQRIALAYFFASIIIYFLKPRGAFVASAAILLLYWWMAWSFGDPADPYSINGYFGNTIDKMILGENHMYKGEGFPFEPEGIMSTLTSIVQVIFGYFVGDYILTKGKNPDMISNLFVAASLLIFTGIFWDMSFPINKKIWTSSYVLYTTGLAMMILAVMMHFIELKNHKSFVTSFFDVFGKNPLFIFVLSGVWVKLYGLMHIPEEITNSTQTFINGYGWLYKHIFQPSFGDYLGSFCFALAHIALFWAIGKVMDIKRIYIRV
ncbi:MAG: hypothetical protein RL335_440 [Bacteroidota bacterium]|jgi:predicted acyltransferase